MLVFATFIWKNIRFNTITLGRIRTSLRGTTANCHLWGRCRFRRRRDSRWWCFRLAWGGCRWNRRPCIWLRGILEGLVRRRKVWRRTRGGLAKGLLGCRTGTRSRSYRHRPWWGRYGVCRSLWCGHLLEVSRMEREWGYERETHKFVLGMRWRTGFWLVLFVLSLSKHFVLLSVGGRLQ